MADDTQTIEQLRKALEKSAATAALREPWQEHFRRETVAEANASVLSTDVIQGFSGSWASSYNFGYGATTDQENIDTYQNQGAMPIPIREKQTKLGQPGFSDLNFVPFNHHTNRFSNKGGSFVGHPISYEVVGPTLKSLGCDWIWEIDEGAGPNGGDRLAMGFRPESLGGGAATTLSFQNAYGIPDFTIGDSNEPLGGLYVMIASDGANPGSIGSGQTPMGALPEHVDTARYELFRISNVVTDEGASAIELHPNKRLSTYFDLPLGAGRSIRALTIIRPYVTRLVAVPGSGPSVGREQTFVIVPPENAAQSDIYPPIDGGTLGDATWEQGGFDPGGTGIVGSTAAYGGRSALPVPIPIRQGFGQVEKSPAVPTTELGTWILENVDNGSTNDVGRILRVYHAVAQDDEELFGGTSLEACMGWFEVLAVDGTAETYTLARVAEVDPGTGQPFFGPVYHQHSGDANIVVYFTVHEPVSSLFQGAFDIDAVQASRIDCLIDPRVVEPTDKQVSDTTATPEPPARSPARADRAIFNTRTFSTGGSIVEADNPGSLLDLGFRMVLFPAADIDADGLAEPDFNRPILGRELIIDPSIDEPQFLTIDYSAGTVKLSHPPPTTPGGDIIPNGLFSGLNNPRGEVVLYAACVPYSREPSQKGAGVRITGGPSEGVEAGNVDVFSARITANVDLVNSPALLGASPYFDEEVALDALIDVPQTGFFDVLSDALGSNSIGTWGYHGTRVDNFGPGDVTVLEGVYASAFPVVQDPSGFANPSIVIRKDLFFGQDSDDNSQDIDDVRFDTTYGSAVRSCIIRFPGANCTMQIDGSVVMSIEDAIGLEVQDEGLTVAPAATVLNFVGPGVAAAAGAGPNEVDITMTGVVGVEDDGSLISAAAQILNFVGSGVSVAIGSPPTETDITIPGSDFQLVDTVIVSSAGIDTIRFSGLSGNSDGCYCLVGRVANGAQDCIVRVRPNGLTTSMASYNKPLHAEGSEGRFLLIPDRANSSGFVAAESGGSADAGGSFFIHFIFPGPAGGSLGDMLDYRLSMGLYIVLDDIGGDVFERLDGLVACGGLWENRSTEITSLDLVASNDYDVGSRVSLYALRFDPTAGTGGSEV